MKRSRVVIFFFFLVFAAHGQKLQYGGMQQFGLVFGQNQAVPGFNLVNGVRFKRFFTGIGIDAQFNQWGNLINSFNTSAICADGRYYINKNKNFFVKADAGVNLISEKFSSSLLNKQYKRLPGYCGALGIGFKAKIGAEIYYSFDVNYSIKQTRLNYSFLNFRGEWQTEKYDFRQHAILVRMGIEIF